MKKRRSERGALKFSVGYDSPTSIFAFLAAGCVCTCASASLFILAVATFCTSLSFVDSFCVAVISFV